jgi:hypothetical protein
MSTQLRLICFLFSQFLAASAFCQLQWEQTVQTVDARPQEKEVIVTYGFKNTGGHAITIETVQPSCGCTATELEKTKYEPGEVGKIQVRFSFFARTGHQEKSVRVVTGAPDYQTTLLRLVANIHDPISVRPEFIMWQVGDAPSSKTIHVTVEPGRPAKILAVNCDSPNVKILTSQIKPGKECDLEVTPTSLDHPAAATITIQTDYPAEKPETRTAYVRVKAATPTD